MAKTDLGKKRTCPETGKKFYDLNKDPIVSPFTGNEYPLSYFEGEATKAPEPVKPAPKEEDKAPVKENTEADSEDEDEEVVPEIDAAETVSLDDAEDDDDDDSDDDDLPGEFDEDGIEIDDDDDDGVLLDDDEDDDDFGIGGEEDDDD